MSFQLRCYSVSMAPKTRVFVSRRWGSVDVGNLVTEEDADEGKKVEPDRAEDCIQTDVDETGKLVAFRWSIPEINVDVLWLLVNWFVRVLIYSPLVE